MSPVNRRITGAAIKLSLPGEARVVKEQIEAGKERAARTLIKDGPLRATLVGLRAGGSLAPHKADGPITVQVLEGSLEFEAEGERWTLDTGSLFALDAGLTHSVTAPDGALFLLTVSVGVRGSDSE
jgi:quercetin dioxygenase-like cupin family protein